MHRLQLLSCAKLLLEHWKVQFMTFATLHCRYWPHSRNTVSFGIQMDSSLLDCVPDDTRISIVTQAMCRTVFGKLEDASRCTRNSALQTLMSFLKHGTFSHSDSSFPHYVPDDTRALIFSQSTCPAIARMLENSNGSVRRTALETLRAFLKHGEINMQTPSSPRDCVLDDIRSSIATPFMCHSVAGMLQDSSWIVCRSALKTLKALAQHGEFSHSVTQSPPSVGIRRHSRIDCNFNRVPESHWNAGESQ
jgi:hypothetical protein